MFWVLVGKLDLEVEVEVKRTKVVPVDCKFRKKKICFMGAFTCFRVLFCEALETAG